MYERTCIVIQYNTAVTHNQTLSHSVTHRHMLSHNVTHCDPHLSTGARALQCSTTACHNDHTSQAWQRWSAQTGDLDEFQSKQKEQGLERRGRGEQGGRRLYRVAVGPLQSHITHLNIFFTPQHTLN